jgi:hypothetical protein
MQDTNKSQWRALLKSFPQKSVDGVTGCTGYQGKRKSLKEMENGIIKRASKHK